MSRNRSWCRVLWCFATLTLSAPVMGADENLQKQEAELLAQVRQDSVPHPYCLSKLARVRERRGRYTSALQTWQLVKKLHANKIPPNQSSAADRKYGDVADFFIQRIHRKQNLAAKPPKKNSILARRLNRNARNAARLTLRKQGTIESITQADMDGDLINEIFVKGRYGPAGRRARPFMAIVKWTGSKYKVAWHTDDGFKPRIFPYEYHVRDRDGDGWKEIGMFFEPETDNVATLYFNGTKAMMLWLS